MQSGLIGKEKGYFPKQAQVKADKRRTQAAKALKMTVEAIIEIEQKIRLDGSPEQVSGKLEIAISHERIYQPIRADKHTGGTLYKHLRQSHKQRKKQYGAKDKRGQIRNRISIDERPEIVAQKTRIGDWEIDTVIGKNHQGALVTIVDRVSKFSLIKKVAGKHAEVVTEATIFLLQSYLDKTLTITPITAKRLQDTKKLSSS